MPKMIDKARMNRLAALASRGAPRRRIDNLFV